MAASRLFQQESVDIFPMDGVAKEIGVNSHTLKSSTINLIFLNAEMEPNVVI